MILNFWVLPEWRIGDIMPMNIGQARDDLSLYKHLKSSCSKNILCRMHCDYKTSSWKFWQQIDCITKT